MAIAGDMYPDAASPAKSNGRARQIDHVIDVVAVSRPLLIADAGDRAVEAVAKPVQQQAQHHK